MKGRVAPSERRAPPAAAEVITGTGLVKRFGPPVALNGVDFVVRSAESVAIMGPSDAPALPGRDHAPGRWGGVRSGGGSTRRARARSELRRTRSGFVFRFGRLLPEAAWHHGISPVPVTHDRKVASYCDRIVEVRDGRLRREGTAAHPISCR